MRRVVLCQLLDSEPRTTLLTRASSSAEPRAFSLPLSAQHAPGLSLAAPATLLILSQPHTSRRRLAVQSRTQTRVQSEACHALETFFLAKVEQVANFCRQYHRLRVLGLVR